MSARLGAARFFLLVASALLLAGCATLRDPEAAYDYTGEVIATLSAGSEVGQTFVSRRPGLNGVQLWLRRTNAPGGEEGTLTAVLAHAPDAPALAEVTVPYRRVSQEYPLNLSFPTQFDPPDQAYYLSLRVDGAPVAIYGRSEDGYPQGSFYQDGIPQPFDLAFRTSYRYDFQAFLSDLRQAMPLTWLILPLLLLLWVPGRLLLEWVGAGGDWGTRTALSVGVSMAFFPVVLLWTTTLGLRWSWWSFGAVYLLLALALVWLFIRRPGGLHLPRPEALDVALAAVLILALGVRLIMVRDLAAPAWVDSVHHAFIARLIAEQGAYPASYAPVVAARTASYHAGFHALTAGFHWLSGLPIPQAMLLFGQVLNALSALAVYLLATSLTRARLAGLLAAAATGLLSPMPAYYTSWGRYTQLAGLIVLPAAAFFIFRLWQGWVFLEKKKPPRDYSAPTPAEDGAGNAYPHPIWQEGFRLAALGALAAAGLFLIHYRVAVFWALLLAAVLLGELVRSLHQQPLWRTAPRALGWLAVVGLAALALSLPWWPNFLATLVIPRLELAQAAPAPLTINWGYLTPVFGRELLWAAGAGVLIGILRLGWHAPVLALWIGLLLVSSNQGVVQIPGVGFINPTSVEIMLFMPLSILAGSGIQAALQPLATRLPIWGRRAGAGLLAAGLLAVGLVGAQRMLPLLNPITLLIRQADLPALAWVEANVPADEIILINPFLWGYGIYAGADGGYWINPIAGRKSMPPNLLHGEADPATREHITRICKEVLSRAGNPAALQALLKEEGIRYVYIGRRGGALPPQKLIESGLFKAIYEQDGVWVLFLTETSDARIIDKLASRGWVTALAAAEK